jgi:hypothetical protein
LHDVEEGGNDSPASLPLSVVSPSEVFTRGSDAPLRLPLDVFDDDDFLNAFVMPSSLCSPHLTWKAVQIKSRWGGDRHTAGRTPG